ncbi:hypothetical protein [Streptomyces sp. NPDC006610]|jgi:hypothetical protein|uniref:hypothetical protein n=1 Tax=Streptomyces sp. NPDC006610 TaxID=3154584 RepID=UPI0033BD8965
MARDDRDDTNRSVDKWADELVSSRERGMDRRQARKFVRNVYEAAQKDLTERNAQAEYEREE